MTARENEPHHVYRYYAKDGSVLYVGCTYNINKRDGQHSEKHWYADVDHMVYETFTTRRTALMGEQVAIYRYSPRHNKALVYSSQSSSPLSIAFLDAASRSPQDEPALVAEFNALLLNREDRRAIQGMVPAIRRCERAGYMADANYIREGLRERLARLNGRAF